MPCRILQHPCTSQDELLPSMALRASPAHGVLAKGSDTGPRCSMLRQCSTSSSTCAASLRPPRGSSHWPVGAAHEEHVHQIFVGELAHTRLQAPLALLRILQLLIHKLSACSNGCLLLFQSGNVIQKILRLLRPVLRSIGHCALLLASSDVGPRGG